MNRKFFSLMTAMLIVMMAFYACVQDVDDSGDGPKPPPPPPPGENLFLGSWISDDNDALTLEFEENAWFMKYDDDAYCSGDYTYDGNTATLTITDAGTSNTEEGSIGTAQLSDDSMTITFDNVEMTFSKDGGTPPPPPDDDLYYEPYLDFGVSGETVKEYEFRELLDENDEGLYYLGENDDVYIVYYNLDSNGQMYWNEVRLNNTSDIETRVFNFLSQKYDYWGEEDGAYYFASSDETIYITLYYDNDTENWAVQYADASLFEKSLPRMNKKITKKRH